MGVGNGFRGKNGRVQVPKTRLQIGRGQEEVIDGCKKERSKAAKEEN